VRWSPNDIRDLAWLTISTVGTVKELFSTCAGRSTSARWRSASARRRKPAARPGTSPECSTQCPRSGPRVSVEIGRAYFETKHLTRLRPRSLLLLHDLHRLPPLPDASPAPPPPSTIFHPPHCQHWPCHPQAHLTEHSPRVLARRLRDFATLL